MTREKLQFLLPVVFTVGPDVNQRGAAAGQAPKDASRSAHLAAETAEAGDGHSVAVHNPEDRGDALLKYAMLLAEEESKQGAKKDHIENIVKGKQIAIISNRGQTLILSRYY